MSSTRQRVILHSDCNCFYASVEMLHHPELEGKPLAVGGDPEKRHGIVLTANYPAKHRGVKTGMALWQARQVCPDLVFVPPRMDLYLRFSHMARRIYADYSDRVESFGLDECWIDVTDSCSLFGDGLSIAREISSRIKRELGITVSIGVSWNKIYAKLGSDYKKPDAITVFDRDNYRELIYPLPAADLLYVGNRTGAKLAKYGIGTIGELAETDPFLLKSWFGKMGLVLSAFARGEDRTPVSRENTSVPIKSIGNSTTTPRDLKSLEDVRIVLYLLSESVAARLKENHFEGKAVEVYVRSSELYGYAQQKKLRAPTNVSEQIEEAAEEIFRQLWYCPFPIRSIGLRVADLIPDVHPRQLDLFQSEERRQKMEKADEMTMELRERFGFSCVQRGLMLEDRYLSSLDAKADDHMIHPHSYFERGNRTGVKEA